MKKIILCVASALAILLFVNQSAMAQTNNEEVDLMQSIFGMEKKAIVADFLDLESTDPFWAIYDEYEAERKDLGKERLMLLNDYAENYGSMNDEKYDESIANIISLRKRTDLLMDKYYKKIKKVSGSKVAAQFFQLESYFLLEIRSAIFEEIPFVGEFEK